MDASHSVQPCPMLSQDELGAALRKVSEVSVAVIGDFCLDAYWAIDRMAQEVSVETGLKNEPVRRQRYAPGGAGNVVMNLAALGVGEIYVIGVVGSDPFGRELAQQMAQPGIDCSGLVTQAEKWDTHTYLKPCVDGTELSRIDLGAFNALSPSVEDALFTSLNAALERVSAVLINNQVSGGIHGSASFRQRLGRTIDDHPGILFVIDSREFHGSYPNAIHKLNDREAMQTCGIAVVPGDAIALEEIVGHAMGLSSRWQAPLVVTRGERGCLVCTKDGCWQSFGLLLPGQADPVGAGDTFSSALVAMISTGAGLADAAHVANIAAAVTAQKLLETGTAAPREILDLASSADYTYHPELAKRPDRAQHTEGSEIEVVSETMAVPNIRHVIFDHDGTISTLREGWERIMQPMMMKAILGSNAPGETAFHSVKNRVAEFIERTTGVQTISQMAGLVDMVFEFGFIPKEKILTAPEYKAIFNDELLGIINLRLAKLDRGELDATDFTIKGAVPFIRALSEAGLRLYLASGTDEEDVKREAERLGYAGLFNGGIHGSHGHVARDAKRIVIERILNDVGGCFEQLAVFGDGPVEMREAKKRGAFAIGVASDELRRFGISYEKRRRLIRAGADALVPDLSQWQRVWQFLRLPPTKHVAPSI